MKISQTKLIIVLFSLLFVFFLTIIVLRNLSYFEIKAVSVSHSDNVEDLPEEMENDIGSLKGLNLFRVSSSSIKKHIGKYEFVNSVNVKRYYPSEIQINVDYKPMKIRVSTLENATVDYYLADQNGIYPCSVEMYFLYHKLPEVVLSDSYIKLIVSSKDDRGYVQMINLCGALESNNLISSIKYDNNNLKDFGRLSIYLRNKKVVLRVLEPVEPARLLEALELVDNGEYDLYSGTMVRRGQEDSIGIR